MTSAASTSASVRADCESVQLLACEGEQLLAILAEPTGPSIGDLGVVIVVGGPQYRAGSHRQFVHLARALAAAGISSLRFDVRGMGDSTGAQRSFEHVAADTGAAIDALLAAQPHLKRVALWGLCDGASAALLYLQKRADPRVAALCLLNPWVRSEASLARTHVKHYYRQRLMQREFWGKLASGRVAGAALRSLWGNLRAARSRPSARSGADLTNYDAPVDYQTRMAQALQRFGGPVLLVLSGQDYAAREFIEFVSTNPAWRGALAKGNVQRHDMAQADHTFSDRAQRVALEVTTLAWLNATR
jgi:uncharacterized protein